MEILINNENLKANKVTLPFHIHHENSPSRHLLVQIQQ